jgi:hypothetical protein
LQGANYLFLPCAPDWPDVPDWLPVPEDDDPLPASDDPEPAPLTPDAPARELRHLSNGFPAFMAALMRRAGTARRCKTVARIGNNHARVECA